MIYPIKGSKSFLIINCIFSSRSDINEYKFTIKIDSTPTKKGKPLSIAFKSFSLLIFDLSNNYDENIKIIEDLKQSIFVFIINHIYKSEGNKSQFN